MKGTVGDVNMVGTQSGGAAFDSAVPMAKSVEDCVDIMDILLPGRDFRTHLKKSWKGLRIAYLNYETWQFPNEICQANPEFDAQHVSFLSSRNFGGSLQFLDQGDGRGFK